MHLYILYTYDTYVCMTQLRVCVCVTYEYKYMIVYVCIDVFMEQTNASDESTKEVACVTS